jgi:uncharacterized RDD family membrane protein YckC
LAFGVSARSAGRDPALAAIWERLVAAILDWIIIWAVSVAVFLSPLLQIWRQLAVIFSQYQDPYSPAAQAAVNGIAMKQSNQNILLYFCLTLLGFALVYFWVQHAFWGATLGKRALGVRVVSATDRSRIGIRAAGIRALTLLAGPAVYLLAPNPVNVIGGLAWMADTVLPLFDTRLQCLHDKLAGTIVIRQRWLDQQQKQQQQQPSPW